MLPAQAFQIEKEGANARDWEDGCAVSFRRGRFAVADGASAAYAAKEWSSTLVRAWIQADLTPFGARWEPWLEQCRTEWTADVERARSSKPEYLRRGDSRPERAGYATFVGGQVTAGENGSTIEVVMVGDTCLFHVSDDRLVAFAPAEVAEHGFTKTPSLLSTHAGSAAGTNRYRFAVRAGDVLYVGTDAIAEWMLTTGGREAGVWRMLRALDRRSFRQLIAELRRSGAIENDDVTLLRWAFGEGAA